MLDYNIFKSLASSIVITGNLLCGYFKTKSDRNSVYRLQKYGTLNWMHTYVMIKMHAGHEVRGDPI